MRSSKILSVVGLCFVLNGLVAGATFIDADWSALGSGMYGGSYGPYVYALTADGLGNLYVGARASCGGGVHGDCGGFCAGWRS